MKKPAKPGGRSAVRRGPDWEKRLAEAVALYVDQSSGGRRVDLAAFCAARPELEPDLGLELQTLVDIDADLNPESAVAGRDDGPLPERLSGHRILGLVGSGGMGKVLLAEDERLGRKLAVKMLSPRYWDSFALRNRFMREARAMARLTHPNVARIYDLGPPEEPPHFVMEYLEGASLTQSARPLTIRQKAELMRRVAAAVGFLHRHGVIHRDLKPANILVGPDLQPKVLDFGLALETDAPDRVTHPGEVVGTPAYFSPEQTLGDRPLDARSDVFSLGSIFYEMLTGEAPFQGATLLDQLERICRDDPPPPRRVNREVPPALQNICLKALEKNPNDRYASAAEMATDLERYLAGEPVLAAPTSYLRQMAGKIQLHLSELQAWRRDQVLSDDEYDAFRKLYERLIDHEDSWIMEMRRFSFSQVSLYLGAWLVSVAAALILLFHYPELTGTLPVLVVGGAVAPTVWFGIRSWREGRARVGIGVLLAFCLLLPLTILIAMNQWGILSAPEPPPDRELFSLFPDFRLISNAQMWWSVLLSLPGYLWLRRFTRASVFTLVFAGATALLCLITLLRMGWLEWLEDDPGRVYFHMIPFAAMFFAVGFLVERLRHPADSRYFHPIAVAFTLIALSGLALFHKPYAEWLESAFPTTRGQVEYLFIINAFVYLGLQILCQSFPSPQARWVGRSFRFVIPGHILTSLLLLGMSASELWEGAPNDAALRWEARFFEILLPIAALLFVFGSIPRQHKNFLAMGLLFLAIGLVRLQSDLFRDQSLWPITLLAVGFLLMLGAAHYSSLWIFVRRLLERRGPGG